MSEETNEMNNIQASMDSAEFESILTDFFTKHKKSKLGLVSRIAFEFKGQENKVLEHLHNKYVLGVAPEKTKEKATHKLEEHSDAPKNSEAPATEKSKKKNGHKPEVLSDSPQKSITSATEKPKSKKKFVVIALILIAALGGTGFLMKDKIMGKGHEAVKEAPIEKAAIGSKAVDKKAKKVMTPEQVEAALDSLDKTKSGPKDTATKK